MAVTKKACDGKASFEQVEKEVTALLGPAVDPTVRHWLPTGVTLLDRAICAGLPGGRVTEIIGEEQSGKTLLALSIARQAQRLGGFTLWLDAEARLSVSLATKLVRANISDRFIYRIPDDLDVVLDTFEKVAVMRRYANTPTTLVVDSVAALSTEETSIDTSNYDDAKQKMGPAAALSKFFKRGVIRKIAGGQVHIIFLNQFRDNVQFGVGGHGPRPKITPGGRSLKFFASTRIEVSQVALKGVEDKTVGTMLQFYLRKNSCGPPHQSVMCPFYFGGQLAGIQDEIACLNLLIAKKVIKMDSPGWYMVDGEKKRKLQLRERMIQDDAFHARIMALVKEHW